MKLTEKMKIIERIFKKPIKNVLQELYYEKGMTLEEMQNYFKEFGIMVTPPTLQVWLVKLNLPTVHELKRRFSKEELERVEQM